MIDTYIIPAILFIILTIFLAAALLFACVLFLEVLMTFSKTYDECKHYFKVLKKG